MDAKGSGLIDSKVVVGTSIVDILYDIYATAAQCIVTSMIGFTILCTRVPFIVFLDVGKQKFYRAVTWGHTTIIVLVAVTFICLLTRVCRS